jgi:site-specific DNA-methyltransferase (adenine-specific)
MKDNQFDLAIVDPPYGINMSKGTFTYSRKKGISSKRNYKAKDWDSNPPKKAYFNELLRISKNQIICGGNYFTDKIPVSRGWIYWDKKITNSNNINFSDGELLWTSFDCILKKYTYDWIGFGYLNSTEKGSRVHPTQKPVALYKWLLKNYAKEGDTILDTHLGSGSSRIACHDMGFDFTGYEIDKDYFDAQEKRFKRHIQQQSLFKPNDMYQ